MNRILFQNGSIIDGSGAEPRTGSVFVEDGRIAAIDPAQAPAGTEVIDCSGLAVTPGFIDGHSHSDLQVLEQRSEKCRQGVTTEVVGNCGFSPYPHVPEQHRALHEFANGIFCGDDAWGWSNAAEYLAAASHPSRYVNVASLTGHGSLRVAVAGHRLGQLSAAEVDRMEGLLDEALSGGSAGFSTGLMYAPGDSAPFEELVRLCKVVTRRGKVYATHMRSYTWGLVEAVEEQLKLVREAGCRLQISHLQAAGAKNWPLQGRALELIEKARAEGVDVAFDCYPYVAGSTVMTQLLPQWTLEGGLDAMLARLQDPTIRAKITDEMMSHFSWRWSDIYISAAPDKSLVGKHLESLDHMFEVLITQRGLVNMLSFNQSEENLKQTLTHPLSVIISDGFYVRGRPHPRLHGTFPLWLGEFVRRRKWLDLPAAIRKITSAPAERFGMKDRGLLKPGYKADITVFDPEEIDSPATYDNPELPPRGILRVFREGSPVPVV
ncbi:MAG: D-aminoacylase [Bryobacterales bacterium]|nr:D-aminoacylase [Bryobacterales bacterium]